MNASIDGRLLEAAKVLLQDGESLEHFLDVAISKAVQSRQVNAAFLARGLAAGERARLTDQYIEFDQVLADLERILLSRTTRWPK